MRRMLIPMDWVRGGLGFPWGRGTRRHARRTTSPVKTGASWRHAWRKQRLHPNLYALKDSGNGGWEQFQQCLPSTQAFGAGNRSWTQLLLLPHVCMCGTRNECQSTCRPCVSQLTMPLPPPHFTALPSTCRKRYFLVKQAYKEGLVDKLVPGYKMWAVWTCAPSSLCPIYLAAVPLPQSLPKQLTNTVCLCPLPFREALLLCEAGR
jgi:hypothetical protein